MTRTIDIPTFQAAVVRNCSPTLAGIKPASLFTYPGVYAHRMVRARPRQSQIAEYACSTLSPSANRELDPLGIHLSVLVWRPAERSCTHIGLIASPLTLLTRAPKRRSPRRATTPTICHYALRTWASRITLASNNAAECACGQNPMRIGPSSQLQQRLHLRVSARNRLLPWISLRRRARVYRPARRELQDLWGLEGLHKCRAGACDV